MKTYLTETQVARMFKVNIPTVRRYVRSGRLPAAKVGRSYVISGDDIDKFIDARRNARKAEGVGRNDKRRRRGAHGDRADTRNAAGAGVRDKVWVTRPSQDAVSEELVAKRCARCELVYAATPENFAVDQENGESPGPWCTECARMSLRQPSENEGRTYQNVFSEV